ncbi:MAG: hypothetical protein ACXAC7_19625 [Candidatus Hodarchaeales archaeon]|jgi:hypothetical protein
MQYLQLNHIFHTKSQPQRLFLFFNSLVEKIIPLHVSKFIKITFTFRPHSFSHLERTTVCFTISMSLKRAMLAVPQVEPELHPAFLQPAREDAPLYTATWQTAKKIYEEKKDYLTYTSLDRLFDKSGLLEGCLAVIHTNGPAGRIFFQRLYLQLMLHYYSQGVIFIDCNCSFPAYELVQATQDFDPDLDPQLPLRAVQLARCFNYHQTTELIHEHLEELLRKRETQKSPLKGSGSPIVIISGFSDLYLNEESAQYSGYDSRPEWWPIHELQQSIGRLKALALKYQFIPIITTSSAPKSSSKPLGGRYIGHSAGILINLQTERNSLFGDLIKHPFLAPQRKLLQILKGKYKKKATMPLSLYLTDKEKIETIPYFY